MTTDTGSRRNTELVRSAFELLNAHDVRACAELLAEDFIINLAGMPYQQHGRQAWQTNVEMMLRAFPDLHAEILDVFGEEDRVAVRLMFRGTHRGEFQGVAPTGREVRYGSIELYRVTDGRLAEEWIASDIETLMHQIIAPPPEGSPAGGNTRS
ncbi:ester cyclase [Kocuria kalidii]|uniref:ester cyclase n=1 Tax=Kocuria kalidii TaxID=3376283 RepID=UPI0037944F1D